MKIAVCYFGNTGGKIGSFGAGGFIDPTYVLQKNDEIFKSEGLEVDYFVHSWSLEFEDKIKKITLIKSLLKKRSNNNNIYFLNIVNTFFRVNLEVLKEFQTIVFIKNNKSNLFERYKVFAKFKKK